MDREAMKEIFRNEREREEKERAQYVLKNISEKPENPGKYNVVIEGVRTFAPLFLDYDGNDWVDLNQLESTCEGDFSKISYFDKPAVKKLKM